MYQALNVFMKKVEIDLLIQPNSN